MTPRAMRHVRLAAVCAVVLTMTHVATGLQESAAGGDETLRQFHASVNLYAALHRRLEGPLPARVPVRDTFSALLARRYLASAIRTARSSARQGDIFDPGAARVFQGIIAEAFSAPGGAALADDFRRRAARPVPDPVINELYPMEVAELVPAAILQRLPALAEDIEYRAVNADLMLWDIHAEIVVDVLPLAFLQE